MLVCKNINKINTAIVTTSNYTDGHDVRCSLLNLRFELKQKYFDFNVLV